MLKRLQEFYRKHPIVSHIIFIIITGLVLVWLCMIFLSYWTYHGATSIVPEIRNMSYAEARTLLAANKLQIEISDSIYDRSLPPGSVIESWPKPGAVVKEGRQVYVTVTAFSPKQVTVSMPLTGNVSSRQAISYLRGLGLSDIRVVPVPSEFADLVMGARYGDTPLTVGSVLPVTATVTLEVGTGPVQDSLVDEELEADAAYELTSIEE